MMPSYQRLAEQGPPEIEGVPLFHNYEEDFTTFSEATAIQRVYAFVLDIVMVTPIFMLMHIPFARKIEWMSSFDRHSELFVLLALIWTLPYFLYFVLPTAMWGQTLGKYIVGLRVIRNTYGAGVPFPRVILRELAGKAILILTFGVGFLWMFIDPHRRMMHDILAKSVVISYRRP